MSSTAAVTSSGFNAITTCCPPTRHTHSGCTVVGMSRTIQVRDVPDDVHLRLVERARAERVSLSELVRAEIVESARRPTMADMLRRLGERPVAALPESAADALAAERPPG